MNLKPPNPISFLGICMTGAVVAGCAGSPRAIGGFDAMGLKSTTTPSALVGSWMAPEAKGRDLLYVASNNDAVNVYTYPRGKLVGSLGTFNGAGGLCVDKTGDVFITSFYDHAAYEYAHGGTKRLATLGSAYSVNACSVDPKTQNVAVSSYSGAIIFPYSRKRGYGFGKYYNDPIVHFGAYCTYDDQGNLFEDGTAQSSGFALSELPSGSKSFKSVTIDQSINGPGELQWKGKTLTVADRGNGTGQSSAVIYRFTIKGNEGTEVSRTKKRYRA